MAARDKVIEWSKAIRRLRQGRDRIEQKAVITRTAFLGTLEIDNGRTGRSPESRLILDFRDENGNPANDMFGIPGPVLDGLTGGGRHRRHRRQRQGHGQVHLRPHPGRRP